MSWLTRFFFVLLASLSIALIASETSCTRRGKPAILPPTSSPSTTISVNPVTGSDTTGDGSTSKPYKTLTKALAVVANSATPNLTVSLAAGTYSTASGEKFPIVVPTAVSIVGSGYGAGPSQGRGTFIDGFGEDLNLERLLGRPSAKSAYVTLEVPKSVTTEVSITGLYVGSSHVAPGPSAAYAAADALGPLVASQTTFAAGTRLTLPRIAGLLVASGSINCTGCKIFGSDNALIALTLPGGNAPGVVLSGPPSQGTIGGNIGIATDGSASVAASFQAFASKRYAYRDAVAPVVSPAPLPGAVDFGQGTLGAQGGNLFIGASSIISEVSVTVPGVPITALGNTWNRLTQGTNSQGQYPVMRSFGPGTAGRNVNVAPLAAGSSVTVGPVPPPTPTPSPTPTSSPTASP